MECHTLPSALLATDLDESEETASHLLDARWALVQLEGPALQVAALEWKASVTDKQTVLVTDSTASFDAVAMDAETEWHFAAQRLACSLHDLDLKAALHDCCSQLD